MFFTLICWVFPVFAYKLEIPHNIWETDITLRLMKTAEGGSKKNTPRKWQSNHLLCLHWQQSVTQSSQRKSSSTAQVCRGILPTPRGTRHEDISGSGTLKGSSEKCLAAQHTTKHTQQAQGSQQHRLIANNCMSLRVPYPQNAESCEESCQQQAVGTPQQQNCWGRRGGLSNSV